MGAIPSKQLAVKILDLSNAAIQDGQSAIEVDENEGERNQGPRPATAEEKATELLRTDLCFNHWDRFSGTCQAVRKERMSLIIRERFIKVTMGKLIETYKKQKDIQEDAPNLFFPHLKQDVKSWAAEGRKLESLCQGLYTSIYSQESIEEQHLGVLYVLPLDMPKEL
ncbi:hypothetical protein N7493_000981 [Penicillium malachiteum]|uniref:Uncharacterized protein n=1 Tax=Penicillium malachiteum TaxID=1324776 RepID=A0AAD6HXB9_9EURO|nr:hypothetical protein N7493_000981 [Penicillium malachiteum]